MCHYAVNWCDKLRFLHLYLLTITETVTVILCLFYVVWFIDCSYCNYLHFFNVDYIIMLCSAYKDAQWCAML